MGNKQSHASVDGPLGHATIVAPLDSESSEIFKLNIDCLDEIFEYLNVKDLHSFGQTCKRMNKVAGEYFKQNYSSAEKFCEKDGIYMRYFDKDGVFNKLTQSSGFIKFMPYISHCYCDLGPLKYIKSHISEFESTNHIYLRWQRINSKRVKHFKQLLPQLEIVQHRECSMNGDFYDLILKHCKNLREIRVVDWDTGNRRNGKFNWLLQEYPKLELLELSTSDSYQFKELRKFFVRNQNVQIFSTTSIMLWQNGDVLLDSNAKLDILQVTKFDNYKWTSSYRKHTFETSLELLIRLHERGFYKRLYIYISIAHEEEITSFISLKGLEFLCVVYFDKSLAQLTNLRILIMCGCGSAEDMEILANGLTKLERLYIRRGGIDDIMPFIRRSLKLNKIKFIPRYDGVVLNLAMMNEERAKLSGARKIIIYTRDDVFLATKWTTTNGDTNLNFIEMRRWNSIKWENWN
ncbi:uncharacterized protein LOC116351136 [Contarinia nasturtii]|uniref:uncharacterized protein LOC116351136 n=1 Tax=Contarinia nasturtii TaxID=265458 RepID=UPI0012D46C4E|nr:uncharacterized protein LOC116351136 [Contarinia nasturtii]